MRSATAPETMVAAVAAKTNWKNHPAIWSSGSPILSYRLLNRLGNFRTYEKKYFDPMKASVAVPVPLLP